MSAPPAAQTVAASSSANNANEIAASYTLVRKDGTDFYCRKEGVTGSRARTVDVCLTKAQLDAQAAGVDTFLQRMRDTPADKSGMDSSGGRTNSVTGQ